MAGRGGQRVVGGVPALEQVRPLPAQHQRTVGQPQLLVADPLGTGALDHPSEAGGVRGVVDLAAVVGVHQGEVHALVALVDVGHAGHRELHELLAEDRGALHGGRAPGPVGEDRGDLLGLQRRSPQGLHLALVLGVLLGPGGVGLRLAHRLGEIALEPVRVQRRGPGAGQLPAGGQGLPQQQLDRPVDPVAAMRGGRPIQVLHHQRPLERLLGEDGQARPHVLAALGVVGGQGGHRIGPGAHHVQGVVVQHIRLDPDPLRVRAHLVHGQEAGVAVERGVLEPLGVDGAAGLREADHDLVALGAAAAPRAARLVPAHQGDDQLEGRGEVLVVPEPGLCPRRGLLDHGPLGAGGGLARDDVGAVAVHRGQQRDDDLLDVAPRGVAQADVVLADPVDQRGQPFDLGPQAGGDHEVRGLGGDLLEGAQVTGAPLPQMGQAQRAVRVVEQARHPPQRVVAGRARAGEVAGQVLLALEDLLDHGPGPVGRALEIAQVAARIGEAVGMVDPVAVDHALALQLQQRAMGRLEHGGVLDPHRGEGVHVEEAPVVQLLVGDLPVREPVPLAVQQIGEPEVLGAGGDGQHVVVVAHHGLLGDRPVGLRDLLDAHRDLPVGEDRPDGPSQHRHEHRALAGELEVEPLGEGGGGAVAQHRPQCSVVPDRGRDRHVVGDDVHDDPHPVGVGGLGEAVQRLLPADLLADAGVVHDVVAVGRAGRGLQHGGAEQVPHA